VSRRRGITASEAAQNLLRNREEDALAQAAADLKSVMSTEAGRRFVWGLIEDAGAFAPSFTGTAATTDFNEGRRSVGLGLMVAAQRDATDLYVTALQEQLAAKRVDAQTREAATTVPSDEPTPGE